RGLSQAEAERRLREEGFNELPSARPRTLPALVVEVLKEPMLLLLLACGLIYFLLGDAREASVLMSFVLVVVGITLYQERKTERALDALRDLSSPRALVIRDGQRRRIAGREVVRGDLVVLSEGDRVPADGILLAASNLSTDESLLTGESVPVRKEAVREGSAMARPGGGDGLPYVYAGTVVVQGQGVAEIKATGANTEMGRIGRALHGLDQEETPLQRDTRRLVKKLAGFGLLLCAVVVTVYGFNTGDWLAGFLAGLTLAMATLPEEFPVVLAVFLALGAWRMSRQRVLTRRLPAVETLGAATVLCVDKTGTLTENRMTVQAVYAQGQCWAVQPFQGGELPEACHEVLEYAVLASRRDPFDPMERAILDLGLNGLNHTEHLHTDWDVIREYPLSPGLLAMSHAYRQPGEDRYVIAAKGAPEAMFDLCHLPPAEVEALQARVVEMAAQGLRVIGVARAWSSAPLLPGAQHDFDFELVGMLGLADPVRPNAPAALRECYRAGIRVIMITGDYPGTAQSVARHIGLRNQEDCITGAELEGMSDEELRARIRHTDIFARTVPEQKLRLVRALKANGEIVAMTGDGVNDAPALKAAHIGIAMGGRGTDVAREAASLVLLDDDFSSIVAAVRMGRRIFDNLRKATSYILAIHVPIAGLSLFPVLMNWPLVLLPVHVAFLELIIDPACSVVFEAEGEEADVMERPPRDSAESLFDRRTVVLSLLQGASVLLIVLAVFAWFWMQGQGEGEARVLTFTTLVVANLALIVANRSWRQPMLATLGIPNRAMWWVLGGAVLFLGLVLGMPALRELFAFAPVHRADVALALAAGTVSIVWFDVLKLVNRRRTLRSRA
ncbi:MAG: cation-translocating P-type ATPase, partial [Syntrophomonadaceae bacterium]|nr:cation-translocating P-type ATPase [Syntrophomonadaceae bacterium]